MFCEIMCAMITLSIKERNTYKTVAEARKNGFIPAVYYGSHTASTSILVPRLAFEKALKQAGESTVIALNGGKEDIQALIHDVQFDPVTTAPIHVDFKAVSANETVQVPVQLEFIGTSNAVKNLGATLVKVLHEIEIEALPANLPHEITVDISALNNVDDVIYVKDLVLPKGVTAVSDAQEVVASLMVGQEEDLSAPVTGPDLANIEVEKKGKKDEEGESAE